jgi:hypothetical protein
VAGSLGIRDVREIEFSVYPVNEKQIGTARPPAVAAIIQFQPHVHVVLSLIHREFDRLWAMALAGHVKFANFVFTKPRYSRSLVVNISFSTEPE